MTISEALRQAVGAFNTGETEASKRLFAKIIRIEPNHPDANHNMGLLLVKNGDVENAIPFFKTALEANFNVAQYWFSYIDALLKLGQYTASSELLAIAKNKGCKGKLFDDLENKLNSADVNSESRIGELQKLNSDGAYAYLASFGMGLVLQKSGKLEEAIEAYSKALSLKPDYAEAYGNIGIALAGQGKLQEAIGAYNKALFLKPDYAEAYRNMGIALTNLDQLQLAIEAYNKALSLKPDYVEAYVSIGIALAGQGKLQLAIEAYKKALSLKPEYIKAYNNMGLALMAQGKLTDAIKAYRKALTINPKYAEAHNNMGNALKEQGKLEEAIKTYKTAIVIQPSNAKTYSNLGGALKEQGKLEEAMEAYKEALIIEPSSAAANFNLGLTLLNVGNLKEGLDKYEWRWKIDPLLSKNRYFSQPMWDGKTSLDGKRILLWWEQGIGDTLNWASCLSLVTSQAKHCILECQEKLIPLLERSFPNVEVKPENRSLDIERDDFDFHLPLGSLYKHFISEISQNFHASTYLIPDPVRVNFWKDRLNSIGKGPYVGISWKSSIVSSYRSHHYPPISEWSPILTIPGVTFINLQYVDFADDLAKIQNELKVTVHNFEDLDQYNNLDDVAALCAALDMVVSTKVTPPILSSGVGTATKIASWRQSTYNNVLNNPVNSCVDIIERDTLEPWDTVFQLIAADVFKLKNKTTCSKDKC